MRPVVTPVSLLLSADRRMLSGLLLCGTLAFAAPEVSAKQFIHFGHPDSGTGWNDLGLRLVGPATQTVVFTDPTSSSRGEIIFSLMIEGSSLLKSGNENIKIDGGAMSERVDSGALGNEEDDEWIRFTLCVSGPGAAHLKTIGLNGIRLLQADQDDTVVFSDGTGEVTVAGFGNPADVSYETSLSELTRLSEANVGGIGDGSWQIELKAVDHSPEIQTQFRLGIVSIFYEVDTSLTGDPRIGDSLGFNHAGAVYTLLEGVDSLNEGAVRIEELGGSMMKIFMAGDFKGKYRYNMNWPDPEPKTLVELAQTAPFDKLFRRPGIETYLIVAHSFAVSSFREGIRTANWRDGLTSAEADIVYKEIFDLVYHLRQTYVGKTFIIQNWEGDNQFRSVTDIAAGTQGMIDWLVIRGQAVADAKEATKMFCKSEVLYAMEVNWIPILDPSKDHFIIDTVIPKTEAAQADFVSLSSWATGTNDPREHLIGRALDYMQERLPANFDKSKKNIIIGEFGAKERKLQKPNFRTGDYRIKLDNSGAYFMVDLEPLTSSDPEDKLITCERAITFRQVVGRQLEQFLHWGVPYIAQWSVYDDSFLEKLEPDAVDNRWRSPVKNEDLVGHHIIRPDRSETLLYNFFKSVLGEDAAAYRNVFEIENQRLMAGPSDTICEDVVDSSASGGAYFHLVAPDYSSETVFELFVQQPGTYQIEVGFMSGPDAGVFEILGGGLGFGTEVDTFSPVAGFSSTVLAGTLTLTSDDVQRGQRLIFRSLGKNPASTGTSLSLDYLKLIAE